MALKNTYTTLSTDQIIQKLNRVLVEHGASKVMIDYENKLPVKLNFTVFFENREVPITLPARPHKVWNKLKSQNQSKNLKELDAYRVAWRNILDWVEAQMAIIEIEQAEFFEVFMPYLSTKTGTLYEAHREKILGLPELT